VTTHPAPPTSLPDREPALTIASLVALVGAFVTLLVQFGVPLTDGQQQALTGFAVVAVPIIAGVLIRGRVYPAGKVVESVEPDGTYLAGPASDLDTGTVLAPHAVPALDTLPPLPSDDGVWPHPGA
jgi:hypothetical protein